MATSRAMRDRLVTFRGIILVASTLGTGTVSLRLPRFQPIARGIPQRSEKSQATLHASVSRALGSSRIERTRW